MLLQRFKITLIIILNCENTHIKYEDFNILLITKQVH